MGSPNHAFRYVLLSFLIGLISCAPILDKTIFDKPYGYTLIIGLAMCGIMVLIGLCKIAGCVCRYACPERVFPQT